MIRVKFLLIASFFTTACLATSSIDVEARYAQFDIRFLELRGQHSVPSFQASQWTSNKSEEAILAEFKSLNKKRKAIWEHSDFNGNPGLIANKFYRRDDSIAFAYNSVSPHYNASLVSLDYKRFLALEAPFEHNVRHFFDILIQYNVTDLVRLTPVSDDSDIQYDTPIKCHPYWEEQAVGLTEQSSILSLNSQPIRYYVMEDWVDGKGMSAKRLLNLINCVRSQQSNNSVIACHCCAGVGRTGTFIAAYLLLDQADEQISQGIPPEDVQISVEDVVMQLSMQRRCCVATKSQYLTLYRILDQYLVKQ
ncbi:MAG: dual specificity protein phosphatase family protein [Chlamydiales bacterium]|nr:dual specificity protein phosphatase family protein [Chlamydiales bacterium]